MFSERRLGALDAKSADKERLASWHPWRSLFFRPDNTLSTEEVSLAEDRSTDLIRSRAMKSKDYVVVLISCRSYLGFVCI